MAASFMLAAGPGFEPGLSVPETDVLPLDDPAELAGAILSRLIFFVQTPTLCS